LSGSVALPPVATNPDWAPRVQAVILAGGTARRMGGISKADVPIKGKRMLDYLLDDLAAQQITSVTVVAPPSVQLPPGVQRSLEDPPLGGPVAGIAAGLARFSFCHPGGNSYRV